MAVFLVTGMIDAKYVNVSARFCG